MVCKLYVCATFYFISGFSPKFSASRRAGAREIVARSQIARAYAVQVRGRVVNAIFVGIYRIPVHPTRTERRLHPANNMSCI